MISIRYSSSDKKGSNPQSITQITYFWNSFRSRQKELCGFLRERVLFNNLLR